MRPTETYVWKNAGQETRAERVKAVRSGSKKLYFGFPRATLGLAREAKDLPACGCSNRNK